MEKYVITIARQFGSMGRPIAKLLAQDLGIEYYDRDIVEAAAKNMGLPISLVSEEEEKYKQRYFNMKFPLGRDTIDMQEQIFQAQKQVILNLAEKESCIIVGRCSDYILQYMPNHLYIYIYAPYEKRLENCVKLLHMEQEEAERMIVEVDRAREFYHKRFTRTTMEDVTYKNLMIDSSLLGVEGTVKALSYIVRMMIQKDA